MTARLSAIALVHRHAEWSLDQGDPDVVRDLPATQREHHLEVARELLSMAGLYLPTVGDGAADVRREWLALCVRLARLRGAR